MIRCLLIILVYDFAFFKLSFSEVTLAIRLLQYKNRNGLTYENRPCDTRLDHDINRDGRCDTGFLFCLVPLPFQNPHNCTLGDYFTGFVGADEIFFVNVEKRHEPSALAIAKKNQRSSFVSLWFQPTIYFRFPYPKTGIGLIVEVFDIDDAYNQSVHDSIDFYGRTLLDLRIDRSSDSAQRQRLHLRSLFGMYTNLTADFSLYCSPNYYGTDCERYCTPNAERYDCDTLTGRKLCKHGYIGDDCISDIRGCEDDPCLNNGTCVVYLRSFLCQCTRGYTGRNCETNFTSEFSQIKCSQATCIHGTCSDTNKCVCDNGWTSDNCNEIITLKESACISRPCLHNSTCESFTHIDPSVGYRCHCPFGYTGKNCEVAIVTACERTPCLHGQCLKIDLYTEICICEETWTGIDCSKPLPTRPSLSSSLFKISMLGADKEPNKTQIFTEAILTTEQTTTLVTTIYTTTMTTVTTPTTMITTESTISETTTKQELLVGSTNTVLKPQFFDYLNWINDDLTTESTENKLHSSITTSATTLSNGKSPCLSNPCLHNSTCVVESPERFQCICSESFIGVLCEIETNPCESSPCQNQGVCITKSNHEVRCVCRPHYTGKYCEKPPSVQVKTNSEQPCTVSCQNGGICKIDKNEQQKCVCPTNFTGLLCELPKNNCTDGSCQVDPCIPNPCLFNGTCHVSSATANFSCSCPESQTGERCETTVDSDYVSVWSRDLKEVSERDASTDLWPLAIIFGYVFSLMLVFIIIWFLWYGLSVRARSSYRSDIPYGGQSESSYQPHRLGVSNPLFFSNHEHYPSQILKNFTP